MLFPQNLFFCFPRTLSRQGFVNVVLIVIRVSWANFKKALAFSSKLCIVLQCSEESLQHFFYFTYQVQLSSDPILKENTTLEYCSIVDMIRLTVVEESYLWSINLTLRTTSTH